MSHNIMYETYPGNCDRRAVKASWDEHVRHADYQEGASGLFHDIRWLDSVAPLPSYEAAHEYIGEHDRGDYDCLAVRYLDSTGAARSKKIMELEVKVCELQKTYEERASKFHFQDAKAEFIGCKNCGSKIARAHLRTNFCPVCRQDMRPKSTLDSIAAAKAAWERARDNLREERERENKKDRSKAKVRWLVKVEYHT